jgi:glutamyl-tRNA reductase
MSITVELPSDIEAQVRNIPDLVQRVLSFLREQVEHEQWRRQRYSDKARSIVSESLSEAGRMKAAGVSREEMFRRLFTVCNEITPQG